MARDVRQRCPWWTRHARLGLAAAVMVSGVYGCFDAANPTARDGDPEVQPQPLSVVRVRPEVKLAKIEVEGTTRTETEVRAQVDRAMPSLETCYRRRAAKLSPRDGRLIVSLDIRESGSVQSSALVASQISDHALQRCFEDALGALIFPSKSRAGTVKVGVAFDVATHVQSARSIP